eukprot:GHUV01038634.1.p1 GENE.GHUV01038634.1~~GHUV01038634.1.p1  ORF type:complete len:109 (+),score=19.93 GHUV01038634.1:200-526(+)
MAHLQWWVLCTALMGFDWFALVRVVSPAGHTTARRSTANAVMSLWNAPQHAHCPRLILVHYQRAAAANSTCQKQSHMLALQCGYVGIPPILFARSSRPCTLGSEINIM